MEYINYAMPFFTFRLVASLLCETIFFFFQITRLRTFHAI